ncbi:MAG TPA: ABC transporter permease [Rhodothermales bacterium]|nr:ABC transporter permease [Rhodothermales bacterium]
MFKNYLKIALRNLRKHKLYTAINVTGLAVGLACCLLILLFVRDELSYDRFHANADRIYRVEMDVQGSEGEERWDVTLFSVATNLPEAVPGVEEIVRVQPETRPLMARTGTETRFYEDHVISTEPAFFNIFDFELIQGTAASLAQPNTVILSESAATRYFPGEDPVGQSITEYEQWSSDAQEYEVVGVMADMPHNVHFRADFLLSMATKLPAFQDRLDHVIANTYVLLKADQSPAAFEARLPAFVQNTFPDRYQTREVGLALMPLTRIHLHSVVEDDIEPQGDIRYVYLFSAIALLVLLIACINYMNLATARATRRAKEVGVRKVVGAQRRQLIYQFLGESVLLTGLALIASLALVQLALPAFNGLMEREMSLRLASGQVMAGLALAALFVGVVAGSYPALLLSGFRPAMVLKGAVRVRSLSALRKGLVVFQFAVSVGLIVSTIIIQQQLHFVQHTRLGFEKDQTLIVHARTSLTDQADVFRQALLQQAGIEAVGRGSAIPGERTGITFFSEDQIEHYEGDMFVFDNYDVDAHFTSTLNIKLAQGRGFSDRFPGDPEGAILINETAARELGWEDPLGKTIQFNAGPRQVVGVLQDFHLEDMHTEIAPVMLQLSPNASRYYVVKFNTDNLPVLLASLEQTWARFVPDQPFDYSFLDDDFAAMYRNEQRLGQLFSVFAGLAILIACMGLFGLAAFTTEQRTKEIGIRKVLGATVPNLVGLLSRDFLLLIGLACCIAIPAAYFVMRTWLDDFAYRTEIGAGTFLMAGGLALLITLATISYQAIKAALANPVKSLRYE